MTVRVNIYVMDFKGQSLVHVALLFSHLQVEALPAGVRVTQVKRDLKEKAGGCVV